MVCGLWSVTKACIAPTGDQYHKHAASWSGPVINRFTSSYHLLCGIWYMTNCSAVVVIPSHDMLSSCLLQLCPPVCVVQCVERSQLIAVSECSDKVHLEQFDLTGLLPFIKSHEQEVPLTVSAWR